MAQPISMDKERVHFNLSRLKKGGENFEVVIDPDAAIAFKNNKIKDIRDVLKSEHIFSDAKKGQLASKEHMKTIFESLNDIEIAKKILEEGEIQLSQEYRNKLHEDKKKKIVEIIHRNSADPKTGLPHPKVRIENAFEEAKVKIDYYKSAEDQVQDIIKHLRAVLPIKFETKQFEIKISQNYAPKVYGNVHASAKILSEEWLSDGAWLGIVEIPAGIQIEFFDKLNSLTHGEITTKLIK